MSSSHLIYPLTARVVWAPQMISWWNQMHVLIYKHTLSWLEFLCSNSDLRVIVLADIAHSADGLHVLVGLVGVDVVQRCGFGGVAIGPCEVYANLTTQRTKMGGWGLKWGWFLSHTEMLHPLVCRQAYLEWWQQSVSQSINQSINQGGMLIYTAVFLLIFATVMC